MCQDVHGLDQCMAPEFCPGEPHPECVTCWGIVTECLECFEGTCPVLLGNLENLWPVPDPAYFGDAGYDQPLCSCSVPMVCQRCANSTMRGQPYCDDVGVEHDPQPYTRRSGKQSVEAITSYVNRMLKEGIPIWRW